MKKALVSVIVPVYNMELYLAETLDSILASDYHNLEVILMDDGSTDSSLQIAQSYAERDSRVICYTQKNAGVCAARNHAISLSHGEYILPVDSDDKISATFIGNAVAEIEKSQEIKVVRCKAEYFGDRTGEWKLEEFSLSLLARKNMMNISALYRKKDWERAGGYCQEIIAREDWEFWISILKDGGKVVTLPQTGLYYRIRKNSKRVKDRKLKRHVIDVLNKRHPEFFERELGGRLHYNRSWSRLLNKVYRLFHFRQVVVSPDFKKMDSFMQMLPTLFQNSGEYIYKGRNELKRYEIDNQTFIVKSYQIPHIVNRIVYRFFRQSKACRSYLYGKKLRELGIGSPTPVGYFNSGNLLLFGKSFNVTLKSECEYTYRDLVATPFPNMEQILRAIAQTTAKLHNNGIYHKDYSAGNILFSNKEGNIDIEIIDLNRMQFGNISITKGCKSFEDLPVTDEIAAILADEYAKQRGFDADTCLKLIKTYCKKSLSDS